MKRKDTSSTKSPSSNRPGAAAAKRPKAAASKPAVKKSRAAPAKRSAPRPTAPVSAPAVPGASKQSQLITLLRSASGASMAQMMTLTGWQTHTVRGMLSGSLRKRMGLDVQCQRVDGVNLYRIVEAAA